MLIKLLSITIIFSSVANVIRTNYLIPTEKDKIYVNSTIYGAVINLIANIIFIQKYGSYGACIGTVLAEFFLMIYQVINSRNFIDYKKVISIFKKYLFRSILMGCVLFIIGLIIPNNIIKLILQIIVAVIIYVLLNYKYIMYDFLGRKR